MLNEFILDQLQLMGFIFAALFVVLGAFDGIYFHLIKYQLHLHPESRLEHQVHTVRGFFLAMIGGLIFSVGSHERQYLSVAVAACVTLIVIDLGLEVIDIYIERQSRKSLGGISSSEMVLHVFASSFRMAALALLLIVAHYRGFARDVQFVGLAVSLGAFVVSAFSLAPTLPKFTLKIKELTS